MKINYIISNKAHYFNVIRINAQKSFWYWINFFSAKWWGIKLGKNVTFVGKLHFERLQDTSINIGDNCVFNSSKFSNLVGLFSPCILYTAQKGAHIVIGDNCGFSGTRIWAAKSVTLGNNVRCGANTYITDSDAHTDDYRAGKDSPVFIDDNVWLGTNVVVLKGVYIGKNSLIGANSVVTKNIPENVIAAGNPCKVIRKI